MDYTISNDKLSVSFTTAGGSFTSIKANGREYLWQGDPAVWSGQAPICFPICGGLRDGKAVTESGKQIELARHGFARKQEWELAEQSANEISFRLVSTPELLAQYPFPFELVASYKLEGSRLVVRYHVTNKGDETMPFFIGGHPGFKVPLEDGEDYSDYVVRFAQPETHTVPTPEVETGLIDVARRNPAPQVEDGHVLPITHELFAVAETIYDELDSREVALQRKDGAHGVRLTFPKLSYLIVWSKPNGDFVAVEPWGGLSTCSDEDDIFEHKRGCLIAQPGETVVRGFEVEPF